MRSNFCRPRPSGGVALAQRPALDTIGMSQRPLEHSITMPFSAYYSNWRLQITQNWIFSDNKNWWKQRHWLRSQSACKYERPASDVKTVSDFHLISKRWIMYLWRRRSRNNNNNNSQRLMITDWEREVAGTLWENSCKRPSVGRSGVDLQPGEVSDLTAKRLWLNRSILFNLFTVNNTHEWKLVTVGASKRTTNKRHERNWPEAETDWTGQWPVCPVKRHC